MIGMANTANEYQAEQIFKITKERLERELGEREKKVEIRENNVKQYMELCTLCISAIKDTNPSLAAHILDKYRGLIG